MAAKLFSLSSSLIFDYCDLPDDTFCSFHLSHFTPPPKISSSTFLPPSSFAFKSSIAILISPTSLSKLPTSDNLAWCGLSALINRCMLVSTVPTFCTARPYMVGFSINVSNNNMNAAMSSLCSRRSSPFMSILPSGLVV